MKTKVSQEVVDEAEKLLWNYLYNILEYKESYRTILCATETDKCLKQVLAKSKAITDKTTPQEICDLAIAEYKRKSRLVAFKERVQLGKEREEFLYENVVANLVSRIYPEIEAEYKLIGILGKELKALIGKNIALAKEYMDVHKRLRQLEPHVQIHMHKAVLDDLSDEEFIYKIVKQIMEGDKS